MNKKIKYILPLITIILFGCLSKTSIKTILIGEEPMPPPYIPVKYLIDKSKFSDIFASEVINTYEAEIIMLTMTATPNNYSEYLIRMIGRSHDTGRILLGLKSGKVLGGFAQDAYQEFDNAISIARRTRKEVIFWDSNNKAIIIRPYKGGKYGCVQVTKKKWINDKILYDKWDACRDDPDVSYYWDHNE